MTCACPTAEPAARPVRLALVIGDAAMRSRITVALVLDGVDVTIAASLDDVRTGLPVVTDRLLTTDGRQGGALYAVAVARDVAGDVRIDTQVAIIGTGALDIVRAANDVLAGANGLLRQGSFDQPGVECDA